jgi:hypothetical protein
MDPKVRLKFTFYGFLDVSTDPTTSQRRTKEKEVKQDWQAKSSQKCSLKRSPRL